MKDKTADWGVAAAILGAGQILAFVLMYHKAKPPGPWYLFAIETGVLIAAGAVHDAIAIGYAGPIRRRQSGTRSKGNRKSKAELPPLGGEYLLYLFLSSKNRDPLLGDLQEEYRGVVEKFGHRRGVVWYYVQVARSLWPILTMAAQRLVRWGVLGFIGQWARRLAAPGLADWLHKIAK